MDEQRLARALGWFSVGLGATEILAPTRLSRALGLRGHSGLLRAFGLRELVSGIGILTQKRPRPRSRWLWSRVAGDALDLGALFAALGKSRRKGRVAAAITNVAAITALDVVSATKLSRRAAQTAAA